MTNNDYKIVIHVDRTLKGDHSGRCNAQTDDEVAIIMVDSDCENRDIILEQRNNALKIVSKTHTSYDALQYTKIF